MMFADFSMGKTKERERGGLFTRDDYGIRKCHFGCLAARRSPSQFFDTKWSWYMPGVAEENTGKT